MRTLYATRAVQAPRAESLAPGVLRARPAPSPGSDARGRLPGLGPPRTVRCMPTVRFEGHALSCPAGARLRPVLLDAGLSPHNGRARWLNCKGFGTCGTCAVRVEGAVSEPSARERARLAFPPHKSDSGLRLACQVEVLGDVEVTKHEGFWGEHVDRTRSYGQGADDPGHASSR